MDILVNKIEHNFGSRIVGTSIRKRISNSLRNGDKVVLDFKGIKVVSNSFADEVYGKLILDFDQDTIYKNSVFKNASPLIVSVFTSTVRERAFIKDLAL